MAKDKLTKEEADEIWEEGYIAGLAGEKKSDNPYESLTGYFLMTEDRRKIKLWEKGRKAGKANSE